MPSALDAQVDAMIEAVTGAGGPVRIGRNADGRAVVENFPATLPQFFDIFCALNGQVLGLVAGDERLSFAELNAQATRLARALVASWGIAKGDRVAIAMKNCPAWVIAYMAALKAGAVATLVNGWWQEAELAHALALTGPNLVIADPPRAARIAAADPAAGIVSLPVDQPLAAALAPLLADADHEAVLPEIGPEDDATILFTSGSTGAAKGAVSSHRAVTTGIYAYAMGLMVLKGIREGRGETVPAPKTLVNVPLFHVTGEVPVLLNSFVVGRTMVLMPKWDPGEALRLIEQEGITYFVGVPTMSLELMQHPDRDKYDLSTLSDIAAGGAPRPVAHVTRLQESFRHAQPALGYGLTETNAVGCSNFWGNYAAKPASTGRAQAPLVEVAILDDGGAALPAEQVGEVAIRSAANVRGYWNDAAATAAAFTADGWFRTGDLGRLDEDGYLFIVDRKKDLVIRGGENISCQEVEAAIYAHPAVSEAAVFGVADERLGEVPAAVIWSERGIEAQSLREFVAERIARFKVPEHVWVAAEPLPKLGTGKIDKVSLRARYAAAG